MKINFLDQDQHLEFAPLSLLKPVATINMGGFTFEDRWKQFFPQMEIGYETEAYLSKKYTAHNHPDLRLAANVVANQDLASFIIDMPEGKLFYNNCFIAQKGTGEQKIEFTLPVVIIQKRWDLFLKNGLVLSADFDLLTKGKKSQILSSSNTVIGDKNLVFIQKGAKVEASILNVNDGPIFISRGAEIMEGSLVRGGLFMGENSALKMGAKIYGATSIGAFSKVGGEVGNSVFQSYSNKGHDGYIGNALIGEWCNLGADTNSSNLKNNYGNIRTYHYGTKGEVQTDQQFMGVCMGDHSKCGINTMFNTATVIGVSANIYGGDFPKKFIPSFSWGGQEWERFKIEKAFEAANNMMKRRGLQLSQEDVEIWQHVYGME
ncbi:MAG: glucose-1-phosphate thymidylyltransferase [Bacteroidetes bacterium]|nr:glucose-1-phosphate thymidylyltransferase [Bacteroidota bacterium]